MKDGNTQLHQKIRNLYSKLLKLYGPQKWWNRFTKFEIIIGAILVQNTNWNNAFKALQRIKHKSLLSPAQIIKIPLKELTNIIKPSGLYNSKSKTIKAFSNWYLSEGGYYKVKKISDEDLRKKLLTISGIGPETADVILLYVFKRPFFIIDNYTQKLLMQKGITKKKWSYTKLQKLFHEALPRDVLIYSEFHALIIHHLKN